MSMKVCEYCGKDYEEDDQDMFFEPPFWLMSYDTITKDVCGECATQAGRELEDGLFEETCEKCGAKFDPIADHVRFETWDPHFYEADLTRVWEDSGQILCGACGLDYLYENEDPEDDS